MRNDQESSVDNEKFFLKEMGFEAGHESFERGYSFMSREF